MAARTGLTLQIPAELRTYKGTGDYDGQQLPGGEWLAWAEPVGRRVVAVWHDVVPGAYVGVVGGSGSVLTFYDVSPIALDSLRIQGSDSSARACVAAIVLARHVVELLQLHGPREGLKQARAYLRPSRFPKPKPPTADELRELRLELCGEVAALGRDIAAPAVLALVERMTSIERLVERLGERGDIACMPRHLAKYNATTGAGSYLTAGFGNLCLDEIRTRLDEVIPALNVAARNLADGRGRRRRIPTSDEAWLRKQLGQLNPGTE